MYLQKGISIKKSIFCWHLEGHSRKEQDPDPDQHLDPHPHPNVTDPEHCQEAMKTGKLSNTKKICSGFIKVELRMLRFLF
jgi:hypothetical protein